MPRVGGGNSSDRNDRHNVKTDASPDSDGSGANASPDDVATRIMTQMVRMPPKPHEKMKIGKARAATTDGTSQLSAKDRCRQPK